MTDYVRALHPCPEHEGWSDDIPDEQLPGCGETVLLEYRDAPPVEKGDVFRDECPSCKRHNARLETIDVQRNE